MHIRMLMNVADPEEARVAILEDDVLEELHVERASDRRHAGDIYKARVLNVESGIQAAFVDLGHDRNGFLHASDIMPGLLGRALPKNEPVKNRKRDEVPIDKLIKSGQEVLVQVSKESMGSKGPSVTTYLSIPGRYLVLMPGVMHFGVSRKIQDDDARKKLKQMLKDLDLPKGKGFIVRTAGAGRTKRDLSRDLRHVTKVWNEIEDKTHNKKAPCLIYQESDLVIRCVRDIFSSKTDQLIVDCEDAAKRAKDYLRIVSPQSRKKVKVYDGTRPLFHKYKIEEEIDRIMRRKVSLPSGGSLVIEQTEAMVVVDVNSGRYTEESDPELTAFKTNMEAAPEVARQLRLRDIGGLVVVDFIDMKAQKHRRELERELNKAMRRDRARSKTLRTSKFGIIEMTRQRIRPGVSVAGRDPCPTCQGAGVVQSVKSSALEVMRSLRMHISKKDVTAVELMASPDTALFMLNERRPELLKLEKQTGKKITVRVRDDFNNDQSDFNVVKESNKKGAKKKKNVRNRRKRRRSAESARR